MHVAMYVGSSMQVLDTLSLNVGVKYPSLTADVLQVITNWMWGWPGTQLR